jgi:hypothetical protein
MNSSRAILSNRVRGRCAFFAIPQHLKPEDRITWIDKKYQENLELTGKDNTPEIKFPNLARRLREVYIA